MKTQVIDRVANYRTITLTVFLSRAKVDFVLAKLGNKY